VYGLEVVLDLLGVAVVSRARVEAAGTTLRRLTFHALGHLSRAPPLHLSLLLAPPNGRFFKRFTKICICSLKFLGASKQKKLKEKKIKKRKERQQRTKAMEGAAASVAKLGFIGVGNMGRGTATPLHRCPQPPFRT
jgi:hypothetical protein